MFFKGSRYKDISNYTAIDASGRASQTKSLRWIPNTPGTFIHTVKEGDRLDLLAFKYYGTPTKWWLICDANPDTIFPTDLLKEPGRKIIIPPNRII